MAANDTRRDTADLRDALAISREKLVRQRVDVLAQIRALSRQLESIDRQLDHIAHTEATNSIRPIAEAATKLVKAQTDSD